jgi:hypothetical protein
MIERQPALARPRGFAAAFAKFRTRAPGSAFFPPFPASFAVD